MRLGFALLRGGRWSIVPRPSPALGRRVDTGTDFWAAEHEVRADIIAPYCRVWSHTDATIEALALETEGHVPWWQEDVPLFNITVHCLSDTTRHAGHADNLREGLDGALGIDRESAQQGRGSSL